MCRLSHCVVKTRGCRMDEQSPELTFAPFFIDSGEAVFSSVGKEIMGWIWQSIAIFNSCCGWDQWCFWKVIPLFFWWNWRRRPFHLLSCCWFLGGFGTLLLRFLGSFGTLLLWLFGGFGRLLLFGGLRLWGAPGWFFLWLFGGFRWLLLLPFLGLLCHPLLCYFGREKVVSSLHF